MTTPERLRRRQLIEGTILIVLAILMLIQAWYFHHRDLDQRSCVADQFRQLTLSYTARADINERDSRAKTKVITDISKAKTGEDVRKDLNTFIKEQKAIDEDRKAHPVPPFPLGKCDGKR